MKHKIERRDNPVGGVKQAFVGAPEKSGALLDSAKNGVANGAPFDGANVTTHYFNPDLEYLRDPYDPRN